MVDPPIPHRRSTLRSRAGAWRAAAVLAAVALAALILAAAPGSITLLRYPPGYTSSSTPGWQTWAGPCLRQVPRVLNRGQLAFCARLDGRVVGTHTDGSRKETHLLVLGGFHMTLLELPRGTTHAPPWGSRVLAVGPLSRDIAGLREMQAVWVTQQ